ncbi:hypothetical protein [Aeropyrum pernix]|nr:hypothetical protein [Aeropyrum pernix]
MMDLKPKLVSVILFVVSLVIIVVSWLLYIKGFIPLWDVTSGVLTIISVIISLFVLGAIYYQAYYTRELAQQQVIESMKPDIAASLLTLLKAVAEAKKHNYSDPFKGYIIICWGLPEAIKSRSLAITPLTSSSQGHDIFSMPRPKEALEIIKRAAETTGSTEILDRTRILLKQLDNPITEETSKTINELVGFVQKTYLVQIAEEALNLCHQKR